MIPLALLASPIARKVMFYGLIAVAVLVAFWAYRRSLINQGIQIGVARGAETERKAKEKEWQAREDQLAAREQELNVRQVAIDEQAAANQLRGEDLERQQAALRAGLRNVYVESKKVLDSELEILRNTSDDQLDDALRSLSKRIDAWQAAQSRGAPPNR